MNLNQAFRDSIQIVEYSPVLDHDVRLFAFVIVAMEVPEYGPGIDSPVDSQQGHSHPFQIMIGECPKAAVGIAILRANSGMHYKRPIPRDCEYLFLEQLLATRDDDIRLRPQDKVAYFGRIGGTVYDRQSRSRNRPVTLGQPAESACFPPSILDRKSTRLN